MKPALPFTVTRWVVSLTAAFASTFLRSAPFLNPHTFLDEILVAAALAFGVGLLCFLAFPPLPNFRTFYASKGEYFFSSYAWLSDVLVKVWILILIAASLAFLWNLIKSPKSSTVRSSIAMLLCLGFNAALHLAYGDDPLLYSADWTYALVFFVGLSLQKWADKKWLIGFLLVFIALLMVNNLGLFANILNVSAPLFPLKP